uniref:Uncharacterized protein n=1 Tax=Romanomermis culicivorax TaxID=13658 RepID=A0A915IJZ8_ROMCU
MLTLYKNGTIWLNYRMKLRAPCAINLRTFPFDKQTCYLVIESYSYNNQRVKLEWLHSAPLTFIRPIELPDFSLTSWSTVKTTLEYPNGFWDQLNATFVFKRRYGFFVLQAYTPTYMTIFVSWISFFMDPRQISARATLGISAFLAMTFQFGTILKNQPPVSYIKSVDFWMLFSIFIMFATLAELAIISYMLKKSGASVGTTSSPSLDSPTANYVSKISALKTLGFNVWISNSGFNVWNRNPYKIPRFWAQQFLRFQGYAISEAQLANNANCKRNGNIGRLINRSCPTFLQNDDCLFEESKRCWSPDMVDKVALICLPAIFLSFNIFYWAYHLFILN